MTWNCHLTIDVAVYGTICTGKHEYSARLIFEHLTDCILHIFVNVTWSDVLCPVTVMDTSGWALTVLLLRTIDWEKVSGTALMNCLSPSTSLP